MNQSDKKTYQAIAKLAAAQTLMGQALSVDGLLGGTLADEKMITIKPSTEKPYRIIAGRPVFHIARNKPPEGVPKFDVRKLHRWGKIDHPCLLLSSEGIGGTITFYVDNRNPYFYLLWTATRVDDFGDGPIPASYDLIAWMPKQRGDTMYKVGFPLFHAAFLEIQCVGEEDWEADPTLAGGFDGTAEASWVMGAVMPFKHPSKQAIQAALAAMPEYLRADYERLAILNQKTKSS